MGKSAYQWAWFLGLLAAVSTVGCDLPNEQFDTDRSGSQEDGSIGDRIDNVIKNP
jgi:hypothetical protein